MKGIWSYSSLLPAVGPAHRMTLGEGHTPLVRSRHIGPALGLENLYFKLEIMNPSGSYKDRFAASAVSHLVQQNLSFCLATSSGNTGAALAAYCAAAGIACYLFIVDGAPSGKLQQMQIYGANTLMIKDFGRDPVISADIFSGLGDLAREYGTAIQISAYCYSAPGMAGVQTIAYEIAEELDGPGVNIFSPAGGGGLTLAVVKGFHQWKEQHPSYIMPAIHCVQPVGNDTIAGPLRAGVKKSAPVARSTTTVSGLQVPNVLDGDAVIEGCAASGGTGFTVTDELIFACQQKLALQEGIFCEPAGAVALAGLYAAVENKEIDRRDRVVCLVTGHGFKDPAAAAKIPDADAGHYFDVAGDSFRFLQSKIEKSKNRFK